MNREEIIRLAREAGCSPFEFGVTIAHVEDLGRFAALVAAAARAEEREACARVCDELSDKHTWEGSYADECAQAIRARGQT
jgi:hypothetical protein